MDDFNLESCVTYLCDLGQRIMVLLCNMQDCVIVNP